MSYFCVENAQMQMHVIAAHLTRRPFRRMLRLTVMWSPAPALTATDFPATPPPPWCRPPPSVLTLVDIQWASLGVPEATVGIHNYHYRSHPGTDVGKKRGAGWRSGIASCISLGAQAFPGALPEGAGSKPQPVKIA